MHGPDQLALVSLVNGALATNTSHESGPMFDIKLCLLWLVAVAENSAGTNTYAKHHNSGSDDGARVFLDNIPRNQHSAKFHLREEKVLNTISFGPAPWMAHKAW